MRALNRQASLALLLSLIVLAGAARLREYGISQTGVDFYHFWVVPEALAAGTVRPPAALFSASTARVLGARAAALAQSEPGEGRRQRAAAWFRVLSPTGTPFFYTVMRPLTFLPYEEAYRLFLALGLAAWLGAMVLLGRALGLTLVSTLALTVAFVVGFEPLTSDVRVSNVNRLLVSALAVYLAVRRRAAGRDQEPPPPRERAWGVAAGVWLGLLVAFKPVVAPLAATAWGWKLLCRRWRSAFDEATGGVLGLVAGSAVGALGFGGVRAWPAWFAGFPELLPPEATSVAFGNYSPSRWLAEVAGEGIAWRAALAALGGLVVVLMGVRAIRGRPTAATPEGVVRGEALALGLGFSLLVMVSHLVWLHYQLLAVPALVALSPLPLRHATSGADVAPVPGWPWLLAWTASLAFIALDPVRAAFSLRGPRDYAAAVLFGDAVATGLVATALWRSFAPAGVSPGTPSPCPTGGSREGALDIAVDRPEASQ